jgi:Xaa-Pro dipeptidase
MDMIVPHHSSIQTPLQTRKHRPGTHNCILLGQHYNLIYTILFVRVWKKLLMSYKIPQLKLPCDEYRTRLDALLEHMDRLGCTGVVLFDRDYILYYSGFAFIPTERPIVFIANGQGRSTLFVPRLELEHAEMEKVVDEVSGYIEYPGQSHPMELLSDTLNALGIGRRIAVDEDGYPWIFGYRGPALSSQTGAEVIRIRSFIEDQMAIKSSAELALIKESVRWGNLAHTLLQRYTKVGMTETEVSWRASHEATHAMLDAIGPIYRAQNPHRDGASAGYRGQIGRNAAIPHALAANLIFQPGDVLVTGATAPIWGYVSELERTMILGKPSKDQVRFFGQMLSLQELAFESILPGRQCSDVDRIVRSYCEEQNLLNFWKHHTGHAIGLRYHEGPFLDRGDDTEIKPGMIFTVEPGLYVPNLGGFRHSDTVLVTESGIETLTYYPRDLVSLTLPL